MRLVILRPVDEYKASNSNNSAMAQNRETENNLRRSNETVDVRVKEAYCWLLVPYIDKGVDMKTIVWDTIRISGGNDSIINKAAKKMLQNESIITQWAPALLLMELDNVLWRENDNIAIKKLWDYLCTYCYLPRLANESVLMAAIQTGLNSTEYFFFASGFDGTRYIDLKFNQYISIVDRSGYLVKIGVAQKQIADEEAKRRATTAAQQNDGELGNTSGDSGEGGQPYTYSSDDNNGAGSSSVVSKPPAVETPRNKHFYMSAQLDTTRIGRDVQRLVEEVISHIISVNGAQVEVSLEVNANTPDGLSQQVVRTVSENCRTLRVQNFGFDE